MSSDFSTVIYRKSKKYPTSVYSQKAKKHTKYYVFSNTDFDLDEEQDRHNIVIHFLKFAISSFEDYYGKYDDEAAEHLLLQDYLSSAKLCYLKPKANNSI